MNYCEVFAFKIEQPLCDFYLTSIKAKDLLKFTFPEQLQYTDENGKLQGSQRKVDEKRLKEIGRYIDSVEMSFPNTIILAVNYNQEGEVIEDEKIRWDLVQVEGNLYKILIPTETKLAAIIDGQHRLKGFEGTHISNKSRLDIDLPCSIFFDLPNSYQAFLFATINGNQKKVDKSLALEQFGFNVEDEPAKSWTPEKLAVFFSRKLNFKESPLKGHIKVAPKMTTQLQRQVFGSESEWVVSTATVVDGILNLISSKPKRDRVEMSQESIWTKRSRMMISEFKDSSPLREHYLKVEDDFIFEIIFNYLTVCKETVWKNYNPKSYIFKTVGVQALFDLLKRILLIRVTSDKSDFTKYLAAATKYDFSSNVIQASGIGRKDIRNALLLASGIVTKETFSVDDLRKFEALKS